MTGFRRLILTGVISAIPSAHVSLAAARDDLRGSPWVQLPCNDVCKAWMDLGPGLDLHPNLPKAGLEPKVSTSPIVLHSPAKLPEHTEKPRQTVRQRNQQLLPVVLPSPKFLNEMSAFRAPIEGASRILPPIFQAW